MHTTGVEIDFTYESSSMGTFTLQNTGVDVNALVGGEGSYDQALVDTN